MKRLVLKVLVFCAVASAAYAQNWSDYNYTNFDDTVFHMDEVSVVAQKKRKIQATKLEVPNVYLPIATNSVSSQVLTNRGIQNIQDAAKFLPSVRIRTTYGAFQQISVRGFDHSVIMVDGVRDERSSIDNSYPFMDLSSVESIELLKGPASVLYGQSAVGGVVNVVRKAPIAKQSVNVRVAYGSYYNLQTTIGFGGKLLGPLNYRANFNYQDQDGWRDNAMKRLSGYLALGGNITDKDILDIRIGGQHDYYPSEIGLPDIMTADIYKTSDASLYLKTGEMLPGLDRKARYNSESDFMYNRNFNISASWKHTFSDAVKLMEKFSYTHDDIDYFSTEALDYLTSNKPIYDHYYMSGEKKTYICLDSIYYSYPLRFSHLANTYNNQLELNGKFETGSVVHNYLGGYSFIYLDRTSYSGYQFGSKGDDVVGPGLTGHGTTYNPHSIGWMDTKFSKATPTYTWMHGFYLQDLMELNEYLKWLLAGRYDLYHYKRASGINAINGGRKHVDVKDDEWSEVKTGAFTFRTGLVYIPTDPLSIFLSYGTYFKPIRTFYNDNTIYVDKNGDEFTPTKGEEVFKPEKGSQFEIGARYEITNEFHADFSVFYINKYNVTKGLANKGDVVEGETMEKNVVGQVGRMDSRGFDVDLSYSPIRGMSLTAGYAFTNAKVREMAKNKYMDTDVLKGKQYAYIPRNTFYVYGDYTLQFGVLSGLGFLFDVSFNDKVYRNTANTTQFDAYWLTNVGLAYTLKNNVRLALNINNVFDKEYYNQSLGNQFVPSMPRNFLASVSYSF